MPGLADLDEHERRLIMLLLPMPDLLRLSACSHSHRAELFRLMHGDLSACLNLRMPSEGFQAAEREASFRAFLQAGGAPLIKSLSLDLLFPYKLEATDWPLLPNLQTMAISYDWCYDYRHADRVDATVTAIIAVASQLRHLRISIQGATALNVSCALKSISGAAIVAGGSLTEVAFEMLESAYLFIVDGVGVLPCPPFQRLQVDGALVSVPLISESQLKSDYPISSAAVRQQRAGRGPFWQRITLRPSRGIQSWQRPSGPDAVYSASLRQLLDNHSPEQLVIESSRSMPLSFYSNAVDNMVDKAEAQAMLRKQITS